jgi:uncharacterized protein YndB with AHSA1/START domain
MTPPKPYSIDPRRDLVLERTVDVPPELVWAAWTQPEHLKHWFTPVPWQTVECEIDLRPGGIFRTVMRSPEGEDFPNVGCYLDIVENRRLVWTDALQPGFRPSMPTRFAADFGFMTGMILIEPKGKGTHYTAIAMQKDEASRRKHEEMGFYDGWGTVLDQLVAYMKGR